MEALAKVLEMPRQEPTPESKPRAKRGEGGIFHPKFRDKKTGELCESPHWWIRYTTLHGKQVKESCGSTKLAVAERLLKRRIGEREAGILQPPRARVERLRYTDLRDYLYADYQIRKFKSLFTHKDGTRYIGPVPALDEFFKNYSATEITTETIKEFVRERQEQGVGNAGINGSLRMLRKMFSLQVKERKFPRDLIPSFPMLPKTKGRLDFLTFEQHTLLLQHLPEELRSLQVVAYDTGARRGELLKLTWKDADLERATVIFRDTKNGTDRCVPLGKQALSALRAMTRTPEGPVFVRTDGKPIKDFRRAWLKALASAGLGKHLFHGNRRSQATNLLAAGVDEQTAMELTGHKDRETFRAYRQLVEDAKRAAIAKRDSLLTSSEIKPSSSRVGNSQEGSLSREIDKS